MANSVNSCEREVIVVDDVTRNLPISGVWSPIVSDVPALLLDPCAGAEGWDCAVSISGVVHKSVAISFENWVDPHGTLSVGHIGYIHTIVAFIVALNE